MWFTTYVSVVVSCESCSTSALSSVITRSHAIWHNDQALVFKYWKQLVGAMCSQTSDANYHAVNAAANLLTRQITPAVHAPYPASLISISSLPVHSMLLQHTKYIYLAVGKLCHALESTSNEHWAPLKGNDSQPEDPTKHHFTEKEITMELPLNRNDGAVAQQQNNKNMWGELPKHWHVLPVTWVSRAACFARHARLVLSRGFSTEVMWAESDNKTWTVDHTW